MYFFLPPFSIVSHLILLSISWSTSQSCCSQIHIRYPFGNSIFFDSLCMPFPPFHMTKPFLVYPPLNIALLCVIPFLLWLLTLWYWKMALFNAQCDAEKTECHQRSLTKTVQSNGWPFRSHIFCRVWWALELQCQKVNCNLNCVCCQRNHIFIAWYMLRAWYP